jgi:hypothetical protein
MPGFRQLRAAAVPEEGRSRLDVVKIERAVRTYFGYAYEESVRDRHAPEGRAETDTRAPGPGRREADRRAPHPESRKCPACGPEESILRHV